MGDVVLNIVDCLLDSGIDEESHEGLLLGLVADLGGKDRVTKVGGSGGIVVCGWLRFIDSQSELQSHNKDGLDTFDDRNGLPLHHLLLYRLTDIPAVSLS